MKTINCHGTPYEIGKAHGVEAQGMIRRSVSFYQKMFAHTCKMEWHTVREIAKDWRSEIERKWPRYHEEMQGISDGAGLPFADILALNIRTEIAFGMFNDGCTSLYWKTESDSFLAQNWDWMEEQKQNLVILDITRDDGPRIKMVTEAGIIGKIGLNELGVGVCLNAIKVPGCDSSRLPVHLALRSVLDSPSADEAVRRLEEAGIAASAHILIADKGKAIGLESTADTLRLIKMDAESRIFHANHLLLPHDGPVKAGWLADSPSRQQRIQILAASCLGTGRQPDLADITHMLDDHDGFPHSICRYEKGPLGMDATLFSIVMELRGRTARVSLGRPCQPEEIIALDFE
ncbi:putative Acyl-coenzyme A:6-aminopenicillanic-acid-acyltransferase 40 kDa form [Penicillium brasilianum]|uniref:Putative Acyl-coenzyme A:6-aminopenicillanic-acid-acyltransferase 40 kDa form n=1 Tax=Penicillium brasilianum TaxID=104259 RepID=A0A1S9R9M2_PENBI|nr:putative Acyl-coenzyme A:6-aminopenicillanic-acid-acyltransferase 40 kDa form [Penicillium brasilianum]